MIEGKVRRSLKDGQTERHQESDEGEATRLGSRKGEKQTKYKGVMREKKRKDGLEDVQKAVK